MTADLEKPIVAEGYSEFLQDLKARIRQAQVRTAFSVNREVVNTPHGSMGIVQFQPTQADTTSSFAPLPLAGRGGGGEETVVGWA